MRRAVIAGSFDPITVGHLDIIKRASLLFDEVYVLVALNPEKKYMFSSELRLEMVKAAIESCGEIVSVVKCDIWDGAIFEYCKKVGADAIVKGVRDGADFSYERVLALQTTQLCPDVDTVLLPAASGMEHISSSYARGIIEHGFSLKGVVPKGAIELIK